MISQRTEDHGLAKLTSGQQNGLAISRTNYRSALTDVLGVCLGVLGVCLGVWIYIYMDLYEGSGITKCEG